VDTLLAQQAVEDIACDALLSKRCVQVLTDPFLSQAVLLSVLVPDRRDFPASRRFIAGGSARRHRLARLGTRQQLLRVGLRC